MKKRVLTLQPNYMKYFKCIGNDCEYHCCRGWSIDIDKKTFKNYRKVNRDNPIKKIINKNIILNKEIKENNYYAKITLDNNKNCPFLNKEGLCEIYIKCGENYLSKTCNQYPRIINIVDGCVEKSCHISCPETAKSLFNENFMSFDQFYDEIDLDKYSVLMNLNTNSEYGMNKNLWILREMSIDILQNREFTLEERIFILGLILNKVQNVIHNEETENISNVIKNSLQKYLNDSIKIYMENLKYKDAVKANFIHLICNTKLKDKNVEHDYNNLFLDFLEGINYDENNLNKSLESYKIGYENIYSAFLKNKEYVLENYLVNEVFSTLFPIKRGTEIFEEYCILVIKFAILKIFLVGIGNHYKCLDDNKVIRILYLYSRNIEHTKGYIDGILDWIKKENNVNMGFMSLLIRK
ncbi:flagellin lysine-N-methylase [Clostridium taeniosporum]|uniref:Lysine-N-methylase n=1 Tax=Clostridium taeniosporum TaxID=394958 RepID=A0A1D7XHV9_9CLOT|nr:flagellin lysine-N-methylase [Clostridium taeniosporum]AOR22911.1 hypothetical protein BGI42_03915 [Clostridium taeniosporum]